MPIPMPIESIIVFLFGAFELIVQLIGIPASLINLFLIGRTSLIHPNLKHILLYQSACILLRGICRVVICSLKFVLFAPYAPEKYDPWRFIYILSVYNRNFVGHIMIIERIMATIMLGYKRSWTFTIVWISLVFAVSLFNMTTTNNSGASSVVNLITNGAMLLVVPLETVIFKQLWHYNEKVYKRHKMVASREEKRTLGLCELYQLSENIRIGKQLMPTLFFHLLNVITSTLIVFWAYYALPGFPLVLSAVPTFNSFCSLMIEITMITCHPFLKRDFTNFWRRVAKLFGCGANEVVAMDRGRRDEGSAIAIHDIISGQKLVDDDDQTAIRPLERHFVMLEKFWEANDTTKEGK